MPRIDGDKVQFFQDDSNSDQNLKPKPVIFNNSLTNKVPIKMATR